MRERTAGVKAKHMESITDSLGDAGAVSEDSFRILIVSTEKRRVESVLHVILARAGKDFGLDGHELYRQAISARETPKGKQTVALVITDKPDDHEAPSRTGIPLWQEAIALYQEQYNERYQELIDGNFLPKDFTVITLFRKLKGQLPPEELAAIKEEYTLFSQMSELTFAAADTEEELAECIDELVVKKAIGRQHVESGFKKQQVSRAHKIAKATKLTRQARAGL